MIHIIIVLLALQLLLVLFGWSIAILKEIIAIRTEMVHRWIKMIIQNNIALIFNHPSLAMGYAEPIDVDSLPSIFPL